MRFSTEIIVGAFVLVGILIFSYMGFHIGAFRFDRSKYHLYTVKFADITGLTKKADIKIAGVKVGWVEHVSLIKNDDNCVDVIVRVSRDYPLYQDSIALIRQDGWFGPKYIEVIPGNKFLPKVLPGGKIPEQGKSHYDVDALLQTVNRAATHLERVAESVDNAIGTTTGKAEMQELFTGVHQTAGNLASLTNKLNSAISRNEDKLDALLGVGSTIQRLSTQLEKTVLPAVQESMEEIATVFDRDFNRIASRFDATGQAFQTVAQEVSEGVAHVKAVAEKINRGEGFIGKLVTEDDMYHDLRITAEGFKNYMNRIDRMQLVIDTHFESMRIPAENYFHEDSKGYVDIRLYIQEPFFYMFQIASSEKGFLDRLETERTFFEPQTLERVDLAEAPSRIFEKTHDWYREKQLIFRRNAVRFGFQFGTTYRMLTVRFGIFEGYAGIGFDVDFSLVSNKFRFISTFEAFDFNGFNRKDDRRPHLKWLNRLFFTQNIYFSIGADDFVSKKNANVFFGGGIRFGDDDIKYLLGGFSGAASSVVR